MIWGSIPITLNSNFLHDRRNLYAFLASGLLNSLVVVNLASSTLSNLICMDEVGLHRAITVIVAWFRPARTCSHCKLLTVTQHKRLNLCLPYFLRVPC